jgi:hypothetical protein
MKKVVAFLLYAALTLAWPARAVAAPGQPVPTVAVNLIVEMVTPTLLKVTIMYTCLPSPTPEGDVTVQVTQSVPLPASGVGVGSLTCDGNNNGVDVFVTGGPAFAPGAALASATACTGLACATDARKVVIDQMPPLPVP